MDNIDWSKSDAEILAWFNEILSTKTGANIRFRDIEDAFPNKGYRALVVESVSTASKTDPEAQVVLISASGDGADLSDERAQDKVRATAAAFNWPEELTSWVLNRCLVKAPRWKQRFDREPTISDIANLRVKNAALNMLTHLQNKVQLVLAGISHSYDMGSTAEEIASVADAIWYSDSE